MPPSCCKVYYDVCVGYEEFKHFEIINPIITLHIQPNNANTKKMTRSLFWSLNASVLVLVTVERGDSSTFNVGSTYSIPAIYLDEWFI